MLFYCLCFSDKFSRSIISRFPGFDSNRKILPRVCAFMHAGFMNHEMVFEPHPRRFGGMLLHTTLKLQYKGLGTRLCVCTCGLVLGLLRLLHAALKLGLGSPGDEAMCMYIVSSSHSSPLGSLLSSLCIIYGMVALFNWVSVSIVALVGPKVSLIISALLYW